MEPDEPSPPPEPTIPMNGPGGLDPGELLARGLHTPKPSAGASHWLPPPPEELAALLPQYHIEALLGHGGMGAVYKGIQSELERPVAIKLLPAELADEQFISRFRREARTLARLQHPGIVAVYDFGQTSQGHLYFVMEFVDGTDLHRIIHGPGLDPAQALSLLSQICDALQYAHSQGVIHRDIKPANILLTTDGRAKLADFGLARPLKEETVQLTGSHVVMGTRDYMAPEQMMGEADHRSDIFALGVTLYEMLTGKRPRGAFEPPSQRVQVDVRLDEVVVRALQEQPERRYQQASEMRTDVDRIRSTPVPSREAGTPASEGSPPRKPRALLLAGTVAVAAISGMFWLAFGKKGPELTEVQRGATSNTSSQPSSSVAPKFPPGQWVKIDDTSLLDSQGVGKDGWYRSDDPVALPSLTGTNHGIRFRTRFTAKRYNQSHTLRLRSQANPDGTTAHYELLFFAKNTALSVSYVNGLGRIPGNTRTLVSLGHHAPTPDTEMVLEFAAVGERIISRIDGKLQHVVTDVTLKSGYPGFRAIFPVRDIEVINLDGLSETDALKLLGVDGKEVDLRAATQVSPSPSSLFPKSPTVATATKDAPFVNTLGMKFVPVPITGGPTDGQRVLFSVWETRVQDYGVFATETEREWPKPDGEQDLMHPAVNVNWGDATAFCVWLTKRERKAGKLRENETYRLPSDHEWSCAVGIGELEDATMSPEAKRQKLENVYPWGTAWPPPERSGNYWSEDLRPLQAVGRFSYVKGQLPGYRDGSAWLAPVGRYAPNRFGLYDLGGNAWEWCEDRYDGMQSRRVLRGAAWSSSVRAAMLSSKRAFGEAENRSYFDGFRIVLAPAPSAAAP